MNNFTTMLAFILLLFVFPCWSSTSPNIILILTDDQDTVQGSLSPMEKTKHLIGDFGITFNNAFATTPICCPSRASILTGRYLHNHKTFNNSLSGGCNSASWQLKYETKSFVTRLKNAGYTTMFAGKYLNMYGHKNAKGVKHVPPGWDWWIGLVGNSKYYNYTLSVNGTAVKHGDDYAADYLTDVIKKYGLEFLNQRSTTERPFMMMLSTPASHAPFTPAPQYAGSFHGVSVPRTPNFNIHDHNKHWFVRMPPEKLSNNTLKILDKIYQQRLETLLSVDDLVAEIVHKLDLLEILNNTYIIYTSDHGYHIGQFGLPWDKRQPYEFDLRIPLLLRGPNILKNAIVSTPVLTIDLAPTILDMANIKTPKHMDGKSFLSFTQRKKRHHQSVIGISRSFLVEYRGEGDIHSNSPDCPATYDNSLSECSPEAECKCQDSLNNTYNCIRHMEPSCNLIYCEFIDAEQFVEVYDLSSDPYQLNNFARFLTPATHKKFHNLVTNFSKCSGPSCNVKRSNLCQLIDVTVAT